MLKRQRQHDRGRGWALGRLLLLQPSAKDACFDERRDTTDEEVNCDRSTPGKQQKKCWGLV